MRWFLVLSLMAMLVGCDAAPAAPATSVPASTALQGVAPTPQGSYPAPQEGYPAPQQGYPAPRSTFPQGPKFTINPPVKVSDTQIAGSGPAGVPIKLVDMTNNGDTIAQTTIGDDGTFTIDVSGKLVAGNRVGLVLGETAGTKFNKDNFISGPGYRDTPFIGIVFDSTVVGEP
ncbi:MAG: hypothetical protein ACJ8CR_39350 [Roseiflexaceae bacterium]